MSKYLNIILSVFLCGFIGILSSKLEGDKLSWALEFVYSILFFGLPNGLFLLMLSLNKRWDSLFQSSLYLAILIFEIVMLFSLYKVTIATIDIIGKHFYHNEQKSITRLSYKTSIFNISIPYLILFILLLILKNKFLSTHVKKS